MAEKTIAEKLLIKPKTTIWSSSREHFERLQPLPDGVEGVADLAEATTAVVFADSGAALSKTLASLKAGLGKPDVLWIAYPKGNKADINRDTLWPMLTPYGMRPVSQVAIDDVWSALRFRTLRPGEAPFTGGR